MAPAPHTRMDALSEEIIAALSIGGLLTARELAQRCPSSTEVHDVSVRLYELKKGNFIEAVSGSGKPVYRVRPGVSPKQAAVLRVGRRAKELAESLPPETARLRREILDALRSSGIAMTRDEIAARCPSARSRHEVSQQINVLLNAGEVRGAVGDNGRRGPDARYWAVPVWQESLPLDDDGAVKAPRLRRDGEGWSLVLPVRAREESRRIAIAPGVYACFDALGRLVRISVSRVAVDAMLA